MANSFIWLIAPRVEDPDAVSRLHPWALELPAASERDVALHVRRSFGCGPHIALRAGSFANRLLGPLLLCVAEGHSDSGLIAAFEDGRPIVGLPINPLLGDVPGEKLPLLGICGMGSETTTADVEAAALDMARWSARAANDVSAEALISVVEQERVFAHEGVHALLEAMEIGVPSHVPKAFEEAIAVWLDGAVQGRGARGVRREFVDAGVQRFVLGTGDGFTGIWDGLRDGPPIARFPPHYRGHQRAGRALMRMIRRAGPLPPPPWLAETNESVI